MRALRKHSCDNTNTYKSSIQVKKTNTQTSKVDLSVSGIILPHVDTDHEVLARVQQSPVMKLVHQTDKIIVLT